VSTSLLLLACTAGGIDDTGPGPVETGDPPVSCTDFTEIVATCEEAVAPIETGAGSHYDGIDPNVGDLASSLHLLIDDHEHVSYDGLWSAFAQTDARPDGTVWDIYSGLGDGSAVYSYSFGEDQCGQYGGEGECYNREHLWPKSWFDDVSPMKSDLHHMMPTDGYVNGKRGNNPFGQVGTAYWTSRNGSKLGRTDQCEVNKQVFEPIDAFKGDVARAFFYMAIRYRGEDAGWPGSSATDGAALDPWAESVLRAWHIMDPVDTKEIDRNQAIFGLQGNRNPFIDHPEWLCLIDDL